jgi:hypothetical protein
MCTVDRSRTTCWTPPVGRPVGDRCVQRAGRRYGSSWPGSLARRRCRSQWKAAPGGGSSSRSWNGPGSKHMWPTRRPPRTRADRSGGPRPTVPTVGSCASSWRTGGSLSAGVVDPTTAGPRDPREAGVLPRPARGTHRLGPAHPRHPVPPRRAGHRRRTVHHRRAGPAGGG